MFVGVKFSRDGKYLAVPKGPSVMILDKSKSWESELSCSVTGLVDGEMITCVDWNHDNDYIVAATNKVSDDDSQFMNYCYLCSPG